MNIVVFCYVVRVSFQTASYNDLSVFNLEIISQAVFHFFVDS